MLSSYNGDVGKFSRGPNDCFHKSVVAQKEETRFKISPSVQGAEVPLF